MKFLNINQRMFRKMGYFDDQSGVIRRYQREREHWNPHLQHTRQLVLDAMHGKGRRSAAVLGSGWLLDVPVEEMSRHFAKLHLYDVRHPAAVKKQIRPLRHVELHVDDISCFAHPVYAYAKRYRNSKERPPLSVIQPQTPPDLSVFDFVFSCNILNQLDILLIDYLSQFFELSHEETQIFRRQVQQFHLDLLPANRSCIVADYEEITYTPDLREVSRKPSVFHPITQRANVRRWTWQFDTQMTYYHNRMTSFEVFGCQL